MVFVWIYVNGDCVNICLCDDDMLLFNTNYELILETKKISCFQTWHERNEGSKCYMGVKIIKKGDSIMLSQEHYIEKLLK